MADNELKYKITMDGGQAVAEAGAVADSVGKVDKASQQAGKSAADTSKRLNQVGETSEKLRGAATVVSEVLNGNLRALAQFPAVLKGIGAAVAGNPLFAIGTVVGLVAVPALQKLKEGYQAAGKAAEEAAKKASDARRALRDAASVKMSDELAQRFKEVADRAAEARRQIDLLTRARIEQADYEEAVALATFDRDNQGKLTEEEMTLGRARIRGQARDRKTSIELEKVDRAEVEAAATAERLRDRLPAFAAAVEAATAALARIDARSPAVVRGEIDAAARDRNFTAGVVANVSRLPAEVTAGARERLVDLDRQLAALREEEVRVLRDYEKNRESAVANESRLIGEYEAAQQAVTDALKASAQAEKDAAWQRRSIIYRSATEAVGDGGEARPSTAGAPEAPRSGVVDSKVATAIEQAAGRIALPDSSQADAAAERAAAGIIQMGDKVYRAVNGQLQRMDKLDRAVSDANQRIDKLAARVENLAASSQ